MSHSGRYKAGLNSFPGRAANPRVRQLWLPLRLLGGAAPTADPVPDPLPSLGLSFPFGTVRLSQDGAAGQAQMVLVAFR